MNRCALREWIPILPLPVCPLAWQFPLGQKTVVGSIMLLLAVRGSVLRGVCLDPIFVTSELHHGLVQSYPLCGRTFCVIVLCLQRLRRDSRPIIWRESAMI